MVAAALGPLMIERACDICRTQAATRLLLRSDLGGDGARMLACAKCSPPEGDWSSLALDEEGLARQFQEKSA
jgi:hypothetical protein